MRKNKKRTTMSDDKSKVKNVSYQLNDMTLVIRKEDSLGFPYIGVKNGIDQSMFFRICKDWGDEDWKKVQNFVKKGCMNKMNIFTNNEGDIIKFGKIDVKIKMYDKCCWLEFKEQSSKIDLSLEVDEYIFKNDENIWTKGVRITPLEEKINDVEQFIF